MPCSRPRRLRRPRETVGTQSDPASRVRITYISLMTSHPLIGVWNRERLPPSIRLSAVQRCHAPLGGARHALRRAAPPCGPPPGVVPRRAGRDEAAFGPPAPQGRDEARLAPVERPPLLATVTRHRRPATRPRHPDRRLCDVCMPGPVRYRPASFPSWPAHKMRPASAPTSLPLLLSSPAHAFFILADSVATRRPVAALGA